MAPRKSMRKRSKSKRSKTMRKRSKTMRIRGGGLESLGKIIEERIEKEKDSMSFLIPYLKKYFCEEDRNVLPRFKEIINKFKSVMLKSKKNYGGETAEERLDTIKNSLSNDIVYEQLGLYDKCNESDLVHIAKIVNVNRNVTSFKNKQTNRSMSIKRKQHEKPVSVESICCVIEHLDTNLSILTANEKLIKKYAYHLIALIALKDLYEEIGVEDETVWLEEEPSLSRSNSSDSIVSSTSAGGSKTRRRR